MTYLTKPFMLTSISTLLSFILLAASLNRCRSMLSLWPLTQWIQKEYSKSKATSNVLTMPTVCITIAKGYKPPKVCVPVCTRKDITNTLKISGTAANYCLSCTEVGSTTIQKVKLNIFNFYSCVCSSEERNKAWITVLSCMLDKWRESRQFPGGSFYNIPFILPVAINTVQNFSKHVGW